MTKSTDDRFNHLEERFDKMTKSTDDRFNHMEERFDNLDHKLDKLSSEVVKISSEVVKSNDKFEIYRQANQSLVNLAFGLIASATVGVVVSLIFKR